MDRKKTAMFYDKIRIVETSELYIRSRHVLFPKINTMYNPLNKSSAFISVPS